MMTWKVAVLFVILLQAFFAYSWGEAIEDFADIEKYTNEEDDYYYCYEDVSSGDVEISENEDLYYYYYEDIDTSKSSLTNMPDSDAQINTGTHSNRLEEIIDIGHTYGEENAPTLHQAVANGGFIVRSINNLVKAPENTEMRSNFSNKESVRELFVSYGCLSLKDRASLEEDLFNIEGQLKQSEKKGSAIQMSDSAEQPPSRDRRQVGRAGSRELNQQRKNMQAQQDQEKILREIREKETHTPHQASIVDVPTAQNLGASCESLICEACEIVVEEFGREISQRAIAFEILSEQKNVPLAEEEKQYIDSVFYGNSIPASGFCLMNRNLTAYSDTVRDVCRSLSIDVSGKSAGTNVDILTANDLILSKLETLYSS